MGLPDVLHQAAKLALVPYGVVARERRPGIVILAYHRVGGVSGRQIDLPVELFEWQMRYLREQYRAVSMDEVVRIATERVPPAQDVVAITFDDGSEDTYVNALPVLRRYELPATVYLATESTESGKSFSFEAHLPPERRARPLGWAQAEAMAASGLVTFGSHTHTHADLSVLSFAQVVDELERSRTLIRARLGAPPAHFAYPWGRWSARARSAVGERFRTAAIGGTRVNAYGAITLHALRRIPIQRSDGRLFFRLKLGSYLVGEEWLRGGGPAASSAAGAGRQRGWEYGEGWR